MKGDQTQIKKAAEDIVKEIDKVDELQKMAGSVIQKGVTPKDILGLSDSMVEGMYAQAYRLYNTGKYKDASQLFRMLIMVDPMEVKFALGLAACHHMLKDYNNAVQVYTVCWALDPENPIPHYHASDCYMQLGCNLGAVIELEMTVKRAGDKPEFKTIKDRALLTLESLKKGLDKSNI